jgi:hypothetical protein
MRAFFDQQTHLLTGETIPVETGTAAQPYLDVRFSEYRHQGEALLWHRIEETRAEFEFRPRDPSAYRDYTSFYPVSYREIDDGVFAPAKADTGWGRLTTFESAATLWVDVQVSNESASAMAALPGATEVTNGLQRQVEEFVVDYISRRGLFPRIEALSHAWNKRDLPEGDFLFELIFMPVESNTVDIF